jgi:Helix-turn-helix domain
MTAHPSPARLVTREEARAALGGISMASLKRRIRDGDIAVVKVGSRTMIEPAELDAYIDRQRRRAVELSP